MDVNTKSKAELQKLRNEYKKHLGEAVYGVIPDRPEHLRAEIICEERDFGAGVATLRKMRLVMTVDGEEFFFPFSSLIPKGEGAHPAFVFISPYPELPNKFLPAEEIAERGYALFCFCPSDVCAGFGEQKPRLERHIVKSRKRRSSPGKIAILAWAISRIMDFAAHVENIDKERISVIGHGTLARAALVAGGYDERFFGVILNCFEFGESYTHSPELFSKGFSLGDGEIYDSEALALCLSRNILIGSAEGDCKRDEEKESEALASLSALASRYGLSPSTVTHRVREGCAYLSRRDWNFYIDCIDKIAKK